MTDLPRNQHIVASGLIAAVAPDFIGLRCSGDLDLC